VSIHKVEFCQKDEYNIATNSQIKDECTNWLFYLTSLWMDTNYSRRQSRTQSRWRLWLRIRPTQFFIV